MGRFGRRFAMVPVMAALMAGTALNPGIMGGIASAATVGSDCYVDGQVIYTIGSHVSSATITHIKSVSVAPFSTFSSTTMTAWSATLRAGIDGNFSASAEANIVIGKADAGVSISLHLSGEATLSGSDSVTWTSGPAKSFPRTYAVFSGGIKVTGTWTKQTCGRTFHWGSIESHTYASWGADAEGSALCGTSYPSGSIQKLALTRIGC